MMAGDDFEVDLVVLVPDKTFSAVVTRLIERRRALATRRFSFEIYVHPYHDPGCARESAEFLRPFLPTHAHAVVLFDRDGSGCEHSSPSEIESVVRGQLRRSGWGERAEPVVLDPELEVWAWSDSPVVEDCLGWAGRRPALRQWLEQRGVWAPSSPKPADPKGALRLALREARSGPPPAALVRLARSIGVRRCTDRAFIRFRDILRCWFPPNDG